MLSTGEIVDGKYRIIRLIGEGGMGAVYEGENTRIHRKVAIKVLHAGLASQAETVARFEREAQAAGRIGSEHIVEVLDLGAFPNGDRYLVMEYLDGDSLSNRIRDRGRLTPSELVPIADQLLEGLAAAHGAGIVHRDLKPDNVFLLKKNHGRTDFVKLLDFGISKFNQLSGDSGFSMTRTGAVMGTPYYMAPEQAKGSREVDHRVDLYAVGVILYECVTGQVPFSADTFNQLLFKIALEQPRPIHEIVPDMDGAFAAIISQTMAREPAQRFQTARELQEKLRAWRPGSLSGVAPSAAAVAAVPAASPPAMEPQPSAAAGTGLPLKTSDSWANTNGHVKKSSTGLVVGLALAGVLVVAGAVAALRMLGSSEGGEVTSDPSDSAARVSAAAPAPSPPPAVEPVKPVETAPAVTSAAPKTEVAPALPPVAVRPAEPRPAVRAPIPKKAAPAKTPSKDAPAPAGTSTGRKYRTTL